MFQKIRKESKDSKRGRPAMGSIGLSDSSRWLKAPILAFEIRGTKLAQYQLEHRVAKDKLSLILFSGADDHATHSSYPATTSLHP